MLGGERLGQVAELSVEGCEGCEVDLGVGRVLLPPVAVLNHKSDVRLSVEIIHVVVYLDQKLRYLYVPCVSHVKTRHNHVRLLHRQVGNLL